MKVPTILRRAAEACAEDPRLNIWDAIIPPRECYPENHKAADFFERAFHFQPEGQMSTERRAHAERQNLRVLALLLAAEMAREVRL